MDFSQVSPLLHGSKHDLPDDVRRLLGVKADNVVYWSKADPNLKLAKHFFFVTCGIPLMMPCFWPHVLLCSSCGVALANYQKKQVLKITVVVTTKTVEITNENSVIESVSLEKIKDVKVGETINPGCCGKYPIPTVSIDDGRIIIRTRNSEHGSRVRVQQGLQAIYGMINPEQLKTEIEKAREQFMATNYGPGGGVGTTAGPKKSVPERIAELDALRTNGIITDVEYDEQRKAIIADV